MQVRSVDKISLLNQAQWNNLVPADAPFVRYEFLNALENSGCVEPKTGWLPQHIVIESDDLIIAALPFYIKGHSYGEYVFDWAWADAYHRHGYDYHPKGICAIPFTPASCPKLLLGNGKNSKMLADLLISECLKIADNLDLSSLHSLFLSTDEQVSWKQADFISRSGFQFHWQNDEYTSFDEFLLKLSSNKRKKIRQERKSIIAAGVDFKIKAGSQISEQNWADFYRFYKSTIDAHGAMAYLNQSFFQMLGESMPENIVMIQAYKGDRNIACSLFFKGDSTLFGRYWGCDQWVKNLHFELCYYQAIEYSINNNMQCFEAGAQGSHKLSRGLLPIETHSAHWLKHPQFAKAIADHVEVEAIQVESQIRQLSQHTPFKGMSNDR